MLNTVDKISVIITCYNSANYLEQSLLTMQQQNDTNFEVIIADDGSSDNTDSLIKKWQQQANFSIRHAWHEDRGFRAASARNHAVIHSEGNYLVFLDGDCLAPNDFLKNQRAFAEQDYFVRGSRVMLSEQFSQQLLNRQVELPQGKLAWIKARLCGQVSQINTLLDLPFNPYSHLDDWYGVKTCNLAVWREDFLNINGFDEDYVGWGHEDADLAVRLLRYGIKRKEGRSKVPVVHLWHKLNDRNNLSANEQRLKFCQENNYIKCANGISQRDDYVK